MSARSSAATYNLDYGTTPTFDTGVFSNAIKLENTPSPSGAKFTLTTNPVDTSWCDRSRDWTIEFWYKRSTANYDSFDRTMISSTPITLTRLASVSTLRVTWAGTAYDMSVPTSYTHFAVVSDSGTQSLYINGSRVGTNTSSSGGSDNTFEFVHPYEGPTYYNFYDEVRFSTVARYSGTSFTVPTQQFDNDDNTVGLFHFNNSTTDDLTANASAELQSSFTAEITSNATLGASAELPVEFDATTKASQIVTVFSDVIVDHTWDTIPNDTWDDFALDVWTWRGVVLFDDITITATGGYIVNESAELPVETNLISQGNYLLDASATLDAFASEVAIGARLAGGETELSFVFGLETTALVLQNASAELSTEFGQLSAAGRILQPTDTTQLSVETGLTCLGGRISPASAELDAFNSLLSAGERLPGGNAILDSEFNLQVLAELDRGGVAVLSSEFNLQVQALNLDIAVSEILFESGVTAKGGVIQPASIVIQDAFNFIIGAINYKNGASVIGVETGIQIDATLIPFIRPSSLDFEFNLSATSSATRDASSTLDAFASEITVGERLPGGDTELVSEFTIDAFAGVILKSASASLDAFNFIVGDAESRGPVLASAQFQVEFGNLFEGDLRLLESENVFRIPSETRKFDIKSEARDYLIPPETRVLEVDY